MGEGGGRGRVGQVVGGHVDALYRSDRTFLGGSDALLQFTEVGAQGGLVTYGGGHAAQEGRYFGTRLGETEDVVNEEQGVLAFHVPEVFRRGQSRQGYPGPGPGGLGHLPVDQGGLGQYAGVFHLQVQVVAFTGALTHAGEHRNAAVVHGDVVDHFHHDDGLAHAGAAEHAHLAAPGEGHQQVDNLDAGFQHLNRGVLIHEGRRRAVNGIHVFGIHRAHAVHRAAHDVEHPAQGLGAHRHHDGVTGIFDGHAPHQTVGGVHGDGAHHVVAQDAGPLPPPGCLRRRRWRGWR